MAGYNYRRGMSNNAVDAYRHNIKPISRFTAQDLREADIHISLGFARWLAKKKHWKPVAWHHSSKYYNKVNFYSLETLREIILQLGDQLEELRQSYRRHLSGRRDSRQRPSRSGTAGNTPFGKAPSATVTSPVGSHSRAMLDNSGWIHLPDGTRKKAYSKWVKFRRLQPSRRVRKRRDKEHNRT